ncbi:MAG: hypothetical protein IT423_24630, partial [Pirellulaceae bacterium]|nr:hypothetical protein [Pirellulaceae bacterium]
DAKPAEPKPEEPKPEEPKPAEPKTEEPKATEPKAEEPKVEESKAEDKPADPKSQSNVTRGDSPIRLVAFQDDKLPPVVTDPPPPDAAQPDAPKPAPDATTPPAATPPAETPPAETPPATPADAAPAAALPTSPAIATPSTPDPAAASGVPSANPASTPMRTQTFEEAKDSIARSLAMNVVRDLLQAKLAKIEGAMSKYASDLQLAKLNEENKQKSERPAPVDLKKLAEAEGLTFGSTGVSDGFRMASSPIGRSMIGNNSLVNSIMTPNVELFQPVRSMFIDMGNATEPDFQEFVSWKTEDVQAYTPALTDVRDEVIDAWKTQKARELAREEAEKLADKLRKVTEEPWKSVLDTQQQTLLINPAPFTWMSPPREMFAPAQITFVQGLDSVGSEFMQRVFNAPAGQVVVAPNQGLTTYYLVRLLELTPNNEELRQNFEVSRGRARQLAFPERERMFSEWYQNIESKLNVQWLASDESLIN